MKKSVTLHPENPQSRLLDQIAKLLQEGGIIVYPTDSSYALGCGLGNKQGQKRIRQIRAMDKKHELTVVCNNLSTLANYAKIDNNRAFRLLKALTPGPYTFILPASQTLPRFFSSHNRHSVGLRIPEHKVCQALLACYGQALASTSLILPDHSEPLYEPEQMYNLLHKQVDLIIDSGLGDIEPTSIIDLCGHDPVVIRHGKGNVDRIIS